MANNTNSLGQSSAGARGHEGRGVIYGSPRDARKKFDRDKKEPTGSKEPT